MECGKRLLINCMLKFLLISQKLLQIQNSVHVRILQKCKMQAVVHAETLWKNNIEFVKDVSIIYVNFITIVMGACCTNRKVAGSFRDGVIGIFY
jgi:hypothetical protein